MIVEIDAINFLTEIGEQVPALSVLTVVVYLFLKSTLRFTDQMAAITKEANLVHSRCTEAICNNTAVLARLQQAIERINGKL